MRVIIASTPKTGNTWMTHLLSTIYNLPEVIVPTAFDADTLDQMESRWITLQHYHPESNLLAWAKQRQALLVTMLRHPGDVLVSIWHMLRHQAEDPNVEMGPAARRLPLDGDRMGEYATRFVQENFFHVLYISLNWIKSGESFIVRYEDLWRDPVTTLIKLTNSIRPVSQERIHSAIDMCNIGLLRKLYKDPKGKFYRKGGPGSWRSELPDNVIDILRCQEPYPTLFRELGYTLDPRDPLIDAPAKQRISTNPFLNNDRFDNGAQVPAIVVKQYLLLDSALKSRWYGNETATSDDSFFSWLNTPVDETSQQQGQAPPITNLAYYIYRMRHDLQEVFPDVFGKNRISYAIWFVSNAPTEYDLDQAFIVPVLDAYLVWCDMPAKEDPHQPGGRPTLTNMALYIYCIRPDLQRAFPDVFGADRTCFARWFVDHAQAEYTSNEAFSKLIRSSKRIILQSLPEASNVILSLALSLRQKLLSLARKTYD